MAADGRLDGAAGGEPAGHQGAVLAVDLALRQSRHQALMCQWGAGHHHQAGGVLVQAVHDAGTRQARQALVVVQQGVLQGAVGVARGRVHHQPGGLVDHQQVLVLVADLQRDGLGKAFHLPLRLGVQFHPVAGRDLVALSGGAAVEQGTALADPGLQAAARVVVEQPRQRLVQTPTRQLRADLGLEVDGRRCFVVHLGIRHQDVEKVPLWTVSTTEAENAVSRSLHF